MKYLAQDGRTAEMMSRFANAKSSASRHWRYGRADGRGL